MIRTPQAVADLSPQYIDGPIAMPKGLFGLPPELRNAIYEYTLPQDGVIWVSRTRPFKVPPLLQVCKQIRNEARNIWYGNNEVWIESKDCDPSPCIFWAEHRRTLDLDQDIELGIRLQGSPNWRNLAKWCEAAFHDDEFPNEVLSSDTSPAPWPEVLDRALNIALQCSEMNLSWDECEWRLEALRYGAGVYDDRWLQ